MARNHGEQVSSRPIELVVVINSFNRKDLLQRAVGSLTQALRQASFGSAIVVFEAGSGDGSRELLEEWGRQNPGDNLSLVAPENGRSSFADGVNLACAAASERFPHSQWLFLYETDNWLAGIEPVERAISVLKSEPELAAVGFTVKHHDGAFCGYGMRFPTALSLALGPNLTFRWKLDTPNDSLWHITQNVRWRTCDVVFTSPLLIRREAWVQTNGFDADRFPFSDSDVDWAWRCAKLGRQLAVIETSSVVHDNLQQLSPWSATRVIDFHRSRLRLLKRHRGRYVLLSKPLLFLRHLLEIIILKCATNSRSNVPAKLVTRRQLLRSVWNDYS